MTIFCICLQHCEFKVTAIGFILKILNKLNHINNIYEIVHLRGISFSFINKDIQKSEKNFIYFIFYKL